MAGPITRRRFLEAVAGGAGALALGGARRAAGPTGRPTNVLFLMTDQHHHAMLGAVSGGAVRTPNLDRLAREGASFTAATCPTPFCSPSRASILTGLYPHAHGLNRNVQGREGWLRDGLFPFTEGILHEAGYATGHFGKWHLGRREEVACYRETAAGGYAGPGYKEYVDGCAPASRFAAGEGDARLWGRPVYMIPPVKAAHEKYRVWPRRSRQDIAIIGRTAVPRDCLPEAHIARLAMEWMRRHRDRPWFLTVSFSPPHAFWVCPEPYYSMVDPVKIRVPDNLDVCPPWYAEQVGRKLGTFLGPEGIREYLRCYRGQVSCMDALFGRILEELRRLGLEERTLVVFTSDHGDMQGGHGVVGKSIAAFYDAILRVPLILRLPGAIPAGRVVRTPVGHVDLMPTILGYLGRPAPRGIHGRSLRPFIEAREDLDRPIFCERASWRGTWAFRMIRARGHKYIWRSRGACELFDLGEDPEENVNRIARPARRKVLRALHAELGRWMARTGDPWRDRFPRAPA